MIKVKEGQDMVVIPCEAVGSPEPTIHWFHNGASLFQKLLSKTFKLKLIPIFLKVIEYFMQMKK